MFLINRLKTRRRLAASLLRSDGANSRDSVSGAGPKNRRRSRSVEKKYSRGRAGSRTIQQQLSVPGQDDPLDQSNGGKPKRKYAMQLGSLELTEIERKALRTTWAKLTRTSLTAGLGVVNLMERVFDTMMSSDPSLKNLFFRAAFVSALGRKKKICSVRDHAKMLVILMDQIIGQIEGPSPVLSPAFCGQCHAHLKLFGFDTSDWWELFGESFTTILFTQECVNAFPYACTAWTKLISCLTDTMRVAFEATPPDHFMRPQSEPLNFKTVLDSPKVIQATPRSVPQTPRIVVINPSPIEPEMDVDFIQSDHLEKAYAVQCAIPRVRCANYRSSSVTNSDSTRPADTSSGQTSTQTSPRSVSTQTSSDMGYSYEKNVTKSSNCRVLMTQLGLVELTRDRLNIVPREIRIPKAKLRSRSASATRQKFVQFNCDGYCSKPNC